MALCSCQKAFEFLISLFRLQRFFILLILPDLNESKPINRGSFNIFLIQVILH